MVCDWWDGEWYGFDFGLVSDGIDEIVDVWGCLFFVRIMYAYRYILFILLCVFIYFIMCIYIYFYMYLYLFLWCFVVCCIYF